MANRQLLCLLQKQKTKKLKLKRPPILLWALKNPGRYSEICTGYKPYQERPRFKKIAGELRSFRAGETKSSETSGLPIFHRQSLY